MYIILAVSSPDEVELWEALVTLAMFPILVIFAYAQDKKFFKCLLSRKSKVAESTTLDENIVFGFETDRGPKNSNSDLFVPRKKPSHDDKAINQLRTQKSTINTDDIRQIAMEAALKKVKHNKLTYRLHANRKINGSKNHEATVRRTEKNRLSVGFRHKAR